MKKVILSLVFVLAISSNTVNALGNDNSELDPISCSALAIEMQWAYQKIGFSMELANMLADVGYIACVRNGGSPIG